MKIKVIIATHKKAELPNDNLYLPVHVGKALHTDLSLGYQPDNEGDNISEKNSTFCELTALYWGWKNIKTGYLGLVHYRRYLGIRKDKDKFHSVLSLEEAENLCKKYSIILPKKRRYYIETLWSHYEHTHDVTHLQITREIIRSQYPDYVSFFDKVMNRSWGHMFNMFIMRKDLFDDYCQWMFPVLFEIEKNVDTSNLSPFDARLFGRISEFLLDVWIEKHNYQYKEVRMIQLGNENWPVKIKYFLLAKFFGKRYSQSR